MVRRFFRKLYAFAVTPSKGRSLVASGSLLFLCFALFVFICIDPPFHTFDEDQAETLFIGSGLGMATFMGQFMLIADGWI